MACNPDTRTRVSDVTGDTFYHTPTRITGYIGAIGAASLTLVAVEPLICSSGVCEVAPQQNVRIQVRSAENARAQSTSTAVISA